MCDYVKANGTKCKKTGYCPQHFEMLKASRTKNRKSLRAFFQTFSKVVLMIAVGIASNLLTPVVRDTPTEVVRKFFPQPTQSTEALPLPKPQTPITSPLAGPATASPLLEGRAFSVPVEENLVTSSSVFATRLVPTGALATTPEASPIAALTPGVAAENLLTGDSVDVIVHRATLEHSGAD
jgi:hypothetical protein